MPLTLENLIIIPSVTYLSTGETKQIIAQAAHGYLADGSEEADGDIKPNFDIGDVSSVVEWSSSDPGVVMVNKGLLTGRRAGSAMITASYGDQVAYSLVSVSDIVVPGTGIVAFSAKTGHYRAAQYTSKRYKFSPTSLSVIKVLADHYPVDIDVIYPNAKKAISVKVLSEKPQRIRPFLVDCCEVRINVFSGQITTILLASSMKEIPL